MYPASNIWQWCHEHLAIQEWTAICPRCSTDAILAAASGYLLTDPFLRAMRRHYFETFM